MKIVKKELKLGRFIVPYRIYGEAKETIVCISGAKQTMAAWRSFVSHLVNDYSIVVFDLPGQGRATIVSGEPGITFEEQVEVLDSIVKETSRNNGNAILAAASWGTIIAAALASRRPEIIDKMILGSFGSKPTKEIIAVIRAGQALFDTNQTDEIAPLMIEKFGQHIPDSHKKQMILQFQGMSREDFLSFYDHCKFVEQSSDIEEFIDLSKITAKTLVLSGEYDAILNPNDVKETAAKIPDCDFRLVKGAGHFLHWEKPEILYSYSEFLARP
ncbi:MAG TPA: alpha/beta hydrolase [Methylococcaceae bacterium]|nr:alpha/beta hydrolase [Methylococcaceae bacterium]